jgi:AraC-like DNA-binding protein
VPPNRPRPGAGATDAADDGIPYRERAASLPGAVIWTRREPTAVAVGTTAGPLRVLPDGCLDLILGPSGLMVAGPDTEAHLSPAAPGVTWVGVRLPPGVGPAVLGVPAHELRDRRVGLGDLWGADVARRLEQRLQGRSRAGVAEVLDGLVRERFHAAGAGSVRAELRPDPVMEGLVRWLRSGTAVGTAADAVGLGARQLHRRSLVAFGYGPRMLARILRLTRALDLARTGVPPARVAAEIGFADQPHLSREVRALAGVPLGELVPRADRVTRAGRSS